MWVNIFCDKLMTALQILEATRHAQLQLKSYEYKLDLELIFTTDLLESRGLGSYRSDAPSQT